MHILWKAAKSPQSLFAPEPPLIPTLLLSSTDVALSSLFPTLNYFITSKNNRSNKQQMFCFCYFRALLLFLTSNSAVCVGGGLGAQNFFASGAREPDHGCAADYGTSKRFQKKNVIDAVTEFPQNYSNYSLNTKTACYSDRFAM